MKIHKPMKKHEMHGFTLIELVIVLAVMAVLVAWGFPSLEESMKNNRMISQNNEMIALLQYAKSEAIRRNTDVEVHIDSAGTGWSGHIQDPGHADPVDGCEVGQLRCASNSKVSLSYDDDASVITFNNRGYIRGLGEAWAPEALFMQHQGCAGKNQRRRIDITPTGQISSCNLACDSVDTCGS